jgi:hypothetical protein
MRERYERAERRAKGRLLDEVCEVTGYHRKAAIRLLWQPWAQRRVRRTDAVEQRVRTVSPRQIDRCLQRDTRAAPPAVSCAMLGKGQLRGQAALKEG